MRDMVNKHLFFTWVLANVLHPLVWPLLKWFNTGHPVWYVWKDIPVIFELVFWSCLISLPAFFMAMIGIKLIVSARGDVIISLMAWCIVAALAVLLEGVLILLLFKALDLPTLCLFVPGMAAVLVAILIRYKQFSGMIKALNSG